ncbi:MAG: hypothetical protein ABL890_00645 [Candidatus Peribacteraceae bacterium]
MLQTFTPEDIQKNKDMAAVSYVWILSIAVFFGVPDSPFARFHARQGIILFLMTIIAALLPVIGTVLLLLLFGAMIYGFSNAARGQAVLVPIVGELAEGTLSVGTIVRYWKTAVTWVQKLFRR